ncbi:hypothetical protein GQ42DRAFT_162947 [Ramicandelaber brevisporus]|nr:hypothetical protein GQ42DRAFT_162947 [Ramicandelaber brevisporus]
MNFGGQYGAAQSGTDLILQDMLEKKQIKEGMRTYAATVQRCFMHCANDFTSSAVTLRFQEQNEKMMAAQSQQ